MSQNIYDIDTIGCGTELGNFFDFYVNNTFYLFKELILWQTLNPYLMYVIIMKYCVM